MKSVFTAIFLAIAFLTANAQQYKPVDEKSEVTFTIKNFGLNTNGSLKGLKGSVKFDPSNLLASSFDASVDVNTINTGVDNRDDHLKKEEYFDVAKYPVLKFTSTSIEKLGNAYVAKGNLTIKGVTKSISIPFTFEKNGDTIVLTGSFTINRKDFNVGGSSAVLSNSVEVNLKVFAAKG